MWGRKHLAPVLPARTFRSRAGRQPIGRSIWGKIAQASLVLVVWHATPLPHSSQADDVQKPNSSSTAATAPDGATRPGITRADLAAAYLRLEQAFFARQPARDEIARINKSFDQATRAFFLGSNADAIRTIDALTESLETPKRSPTERALVSMKVIVEPPVWLAGQSLRALCRVTSMYEWPSSEPLESNLQLSLVSPKGKRVLDYRFAVTLGKGRLVDAKVPLEVAADDRLAPGMYRVELSPADGSGLVAGRVNVINGAALDEKRGAHEKRLAQLKLSTPQMAQALASLRARNRLLSDRPSEDNSIQFLSDLNALASDVASEIQALESGKDPYAHRSGDYWRVLQLGKREIPLRLYVPNLAAQDTPAPLLVVLHGMGGDENMFLEAYGAGTVKRLADEKVLIVASPLTYSFGSDIKTLRALIDALSYDYSIDADRVYVLGHSMGAGAAAGLARGHGDTVAAACCIAGGRFQAKSGSPPILVVSPELDGVVPPKRLRESAQKAISDGMPGELKIMPSYGHTLAVGAILPEALDWLLRHRRSAPP